MNEGQVLSGLREGFVPRSKRQANMVHCKIHVFLNGLDVFRK
jgi:hypothetical protein